MSLRRGIGGFLTKAPSMKCPDCDEDTIFKCGTLLRELTPLKVVPEDHLYRMYADIYYEHGVFENLCSECTRGDRKIALWVVVGNRLRGPLCDNCYREFLTGVDADFAYGGEREFTDDAYVYFIRNNKTTRETIADLASFFEEDDQEKEEELDPTKLF